MATPYFLRPTPRIRRFSPSLRAALTTFAVASLVAATGCGVATRAVPTAPARSIVPLRPNSLALGETRPLGAPFRVAHISPAHTTWIALIDGASTQLDIGQFYIANQAGSRLEAVISAVERAARRGVKVRVLVDAIFAKKYPQTLLRLRRVAQVRTFDVKAHMGGVLHAKYFLIDRRAAWLGSQNFDWRSLAHIHELGVRLNVPSVVAPLQATFDLDWALAAQAPTAAPPATKALSDWTKLPPPTYAAARWGTHAVTIAAVGSPAGFLPRGLAWELPALVRWLDQAKSSVRLQLLSMHLRARDGADFPVLFDALRRAAKRGVRVSILLAHWSKSRRSARELSVLQREAGVTVRFATIPPHESGFIPFARVIHSKYLIVDGERVWIGTSNWSKGYFYTSRNVGVLVRGKAFADALVGVFEGLWQGPMSETFVPGRDYPRPRVAR